MGHKRRAKKRNGRSRISLPRDARLLARPWRLYRRGLGRFALFALGSLAVAAFGYIYLRSVVPVSVSAVLSSSGNASFSYATRQQDTYSPACGCMADKSERWRGITFAARRLQIANVTETAHTAFWLMAAEPAPLDWSPTLFRPRIRLLRLSIVNGTAIGLEDILRARTTDSVAVIEDTTQAEQDAAALVTNQPVVVMLPGDYPVVAYIPVENSRVSITQRESTFPSDRDAPVIREDYPATRDRADKVGNVVGGAGLAYPMMDFVGPQTILVTEDPDAVFAYANHTATLNASHAPGRRSVTAIIVNSPFSTRISAMPLGDRVDKLPPSDPGPEPMYSHFAEPDGPARPLGPDEEIVNIGEGPVHLPTDVVPRKRGTLELTVLESLVPADYSRLEHSLERTDTVAGQEIRSRAHEIDHVSLEYRYPPIPPVGGFNVFGLLAQLALHVKAGRIMIGSSTVPIDAPSVVEFKEILAFTPRHNVVPIPLIVNGREQTMDFSVEATSKLSINGAPIRVQADRKRAVIGYTVGLATIIQAIAAVAAVWPRASRGARNQPQ
jgi:hypothetical protein